MKVFYAFISIIQIALLDKSNEWMLSFSHTQKQEQQCKLTQWPEDREPTDKNVSNKIINQLDASAEIEKKKKNHV